MKQITLDSCFHFILFLFALTLLGSSSTTLASTQAAENQVGFDRLEENTIFFNAPSGTETPKPLKTNLFDLTFIGTLRPNDGGLPFLFFSGKPCKACLDDRVIYAIRPTGGKPFAFVYPGRIVDPKKRVLVHESRAFIGKCLPNKGEIYVVFQKEKVDRRRFLQSSVLIAEPSKDFLQESLLERRLPQLKTALQMVKRKSCKEVEGRNRMMLSIPLDLHPKDNSDNEEQESDELPKEKG